MSWQNELKPEIKLTSPSGKIFYALWRKNDRSFVKKLGIFSPPNFPGDIIQDLDHASDSYPLTFYFDGPFHNQVADDFYEAAKERGQWEIIHPVKGPLILQLAQCKESIDPTESGNYTEFETSWLAPANLERTVSPTELTTDIISQAITTIDDAQIVMQQFKTELYAFIQSSINIFNAVVGLADKFIKDIASIEAEAIDLYESGRATLIGFIEDYGIVDSDTTNIGEAFANLFISPVNATSDFGARYSAFSDLIDGIFTYVPTTTDPEDYNTVIGIEFFITLALVMIAEIVATSDYASRADVVSVMENITTIFRSVIDRIEAVQSEYKDLAIDLQYFSQTKTYTSLVTLYAYVMQYLIEQFYNLKVEKRFMLKRQRSPIEITVTEYGDENFEENYDLFLKSNSLTGNEILLLPAGKEVVIYA